MSSEKPRVAPELRPRLTVIGVGGAGCNAVNNMIASGLRGADFVVANTDAQSLAISSAEHRIQLGVNLTEGLGAGSKPEIGEAAAEEALDDIRGQLKSSHMVFIAAGMGGGTGTGAAAVIARVAKELGVLTVGVVTRPFLFEGSRRTRIADDGIDELKKYVDTLIVIPNQNLFRIANDKTTFAEAFILADQVLYSGVACIIDLIIKEGLINLDFADVRTVMSGMGTAMMGTGEAAGDRRAIIAAEEAISNPLLDDVSLKGAKGLLLSITGGRQLTLYEVDEAASRVRQEVDAEANIIVGATFDDSLGDRVRVSIVASGMNRVPPSVQAGAPQARDPKHPVHEPNQRAFAHSGAKTDGTDDLSSRLSAAFGPRSAVAVSEPAASQAGRTWQAPGDVTIEERPPQFSQNQPGFGQPTARQTHAQSPFTPSGPAEHRRGHRRLPSVSDFPPVGQREYLAKSRGSDREGHSDDADPDAGHRRGSFLQRLSGLMRGDSQDADIDSKEPYRGLRRALESSGERPDTRLRTQGRDGDFERDDENGETSSVFRRPWRSQR